MQGFRRHSRTRLALASLAGLTALALMASPYGAATQAPFALADKAAFARGGGGQGGGQGGGHGGGHGNGKGQGSAEHAGAHATAKKDGATLGGRVNAAHASDRARERAADHSAVGRMAAYEAALAINDLDLAAKTLAEVANKTVDQAVVDAVNELLGVETELDSADIAEATAQAQADSSGSHGLGHGQSEEEAAAAAEPDYSDAVLN